MRRNARRTAQKLKRALKDKLLHWYAAVRRLEDYAFRARERAKSWRGFNVGASSLCLLPNGDFVSFTGANRKDAEGLRGPHDHCAEPEIIDQARAAGAKEIVGFVTVAPHQPDDFSGVDLGVTTICVYCRKRFHQELADEKSPLKPHTRMIFVNADDRTRRVELPVDKLLALLEK